MSISRSAETKVFDAAVSINKCLAICFQKYVDDCCAKIKQVDSERFQAAMDDVISEFQQKSSDGIKFILEEYSLTEHVTKLNHANRTLLSDKVWCPSGDPCKDMRARYFAVDRAYVDKLSRRTVDLNKELRPKLNEYRNQKKRLHNEWTDLQLMYKQVDCLLSLVRSVDQTCSKHASFIITDNPG